MLFLSGVAHGVDMRRYMSLFVNLREFTIGHLQTLRCKMNFVNIKCFKMISYILQHRRQYPGVCIDH
jgi:hypothetical protein